MKTQQFGGFGIKVTVDGRPYQGIANEDRTEFNLAGVRDLDLTSGSTIIDECGVKYRVEQCAQMIGGYTRLRVRSLA